MGNGELQNLYRFTEYYYDDQIKDNFMGGACVTNGA